MARARVRTELLDTAVLFVTPAPKMRRHEAQRIIQVDDFGASDLHSITYSVRLRHLA